VNNNSSTSGDAASVVMLNVDVIGDTPTPTASPSVTPTPTPTATPLTACPAAADPGCEVGFGKGILLVKEVVPGKEKLVAKLLKGPSLVQTDMGNPLDVGQGGTGTSYLLCVYDAASNLAGGVFVDRAGDICDDQPCWKPVGKAPNDPNGPGKGYKYKDGSLAAGGILKIIYKGGIVVGTSKAIVIGKGPGLPSGVAAALQSSSQATVQLRSSDGICLSATLTDVKRQNADFFLVK
jgi:hypothetical protein